MRVFISPAMGSLNGLHSYSVFIQSAVQLMLLVHGFTHTHARTNQLVRCNWGLNVQRDFNTPRAGSNWQPSNCQRIAHTSRDPSLHIPFADLVMHFTTDVGGKNCKQFGWGVVPYRCSKSCSYNRQAFLTLPVKPWQTCAAVATTLGLKVKSYQSV